MEGIIRTLCAVCQILGVEANETGICPMHSESKLDIGFDSRSVAVTNVPLRAVLDSMGRENSPVAGQR